MNMQEFKKNIFNIIGDFEIIENEPFIIKVKARKRIDRIKRKIFYEWVYQNLEVCILVKLIYKESKNERAKTVFKRVWINTFKKEIRLLIKITKVLNDWLQQRTTT